jgi:hypothetical protein
MVEPLVLPSVNATISSEQLRCSLRELHLYLTDVLSAASSNTQRMDTENSVILDFLREDERYLTDNNLQLFHPASSPGIGVHYRIIRNQSNNDNNMLVSQLTTLILSANRPSDAGPAKIDPTIGLFGILITIGSTGISYGLCSNSLQSTLQQRLNYVLSLLRTNSKIIEDPNAAKELLFNFLVLDDELRKNNHRMLTPDTMIIPESTTSSNTRNNILSPMGMMSPINMMSPIADIAGLVVRKGNRAGGGNAGNLGTDDGTGQQHEFGFSLTPLEKKGAIATRVLVERLRVLSVAENDSKLRKYETTGAERKANYLSEVFGNSTNTKSRFRRPTRKGEKADFDNFDYKGPTREASTLKSIAAATTFPNAMPGTASNLKVATTFPIIAPPTGSIIPETPNSVNTAGKLTTLKSSKKDTTTRRTTAANSRRNINQGPTFADDESTGQQSSRRISVESSSALSKTKRTVKNIVPDDTEKSQLSSSHGADGNSVNSGNPQSTNSGSNSVITLNVALNEDLTCSYKSSILSACVVEGFVQVSIKTDSAVVRQAAGTSTTFAIVIRDSMKQVESISENKKVVQDVSRLSDDNAYKLVVNVPKFDTYFALLKYKCNTELRPVPIVSEQLYRDPSASDCFVI